MKKCIYLALFFTIGFSVASFAKSIPLTSADTAGVNANARVIEYGYFTDPISNAVITVSYRTDHILSVQVTDSYGNPLTLDVPASGNGLGYIYKGVSYNAGILTVNTFYVYYILADGVTHMSSYYTGDLTPL